MSKFLLGRRQFALGAAAVATNALIPKGNASYKYAEVWIDAAGMPVQSKIVEKNDDSTTMRLSDVEKNIKLSDGDFKISLDSDVKVIKS